MRGPVTIRVSAPPDRLLALPGIRRVRRSAFVVPSTAFNRGRSGPWGRSSACCTDGRDGLRGGPFLPFGCRLHAAQSECCSPPPHSAAEATRDELGGV